jgi:hypothetical protein
MGAADESGLGNYTSNDEYAIASVRDGEENHGEILYRIVIVNGGTNPVEDVRVVDKLPVIGDTSLSGSSRLSKWPVEFDSILSAVDGNGDPVHYSLYSTTGKTNAEYWSAIQHGPTGWSSGAGSDAKAILLDFSQTSGADAYTLEPGGKIIITYRAWAPSESLGEETLGGYYFEASVNDAAAAVDTYSTAGSGPAKVVLMPSSVGAGNRVWIDKNANGVQDAIILTTSHRSPASLPIPAAALRFHCSSTSTAIPTPPSRVPSVWAPTASSVRRPDPRDAQERRRRG